MDDEQFGRLMGEALEALAREDDLRALALADQLAAERPDAPVVRALRAQVLLRREDFDSAEEALHEARRAVELAPNDPLAHWLAATAAWRVGRIGPAQESFEEAVALSGRAPRLMADYAWFMAQQRGPRPAEQAARAAIDADPSNSTAWAALGMAQYRLHQYREAERSLCEALRLDPNDIYAQSAMAVLLQQTGRDDQAVAITRLLEDVRGTEDFVQSVRRGAQQRRLARMLADRNVMPELPERESASYAWVWALAIAMLLVPVVLIAFAPKSIGLFLVILLVPLLLRRWRDS